MEKCKGQARMDTSLGPKNAGKNGTPVTSPQEMADKKDKNKNNQDLQTTLDETVQKLRNI